MQGPPPRSLRRLRRTQEGPQTARFASLFVNARVVVCEACRTRRRSRSCRSRRSTCSPRCCRTPRPARRTRSTRASPHATCLLGDMRRAVIFAYDGDRRLVRAVGAHGVGLELFAGASPTAEQVAVAAEALRDDEVIELAHVERAAARGVPPAARRRHGRLHPDVGRRARDRRDRRRPARGARPADQRAAPQPVVAGEDRRPGRRRAPRHARARARAAALASGSTSRATCTRRSSSGCSASRWRCRATASSAPSIARAHARRSRPRSASCAARCSARSPRPAARPRPPSATS